MATNNFEAFILLLKEKFKGELPGKQAQFKLAPVNRSKISEDTINDYHTGAVLLYVFPEKNIPHILFIERADDGKVHSGQIAFPGGKTELSDENYLHTAIRETNEETGIHVSLTDILGKLTTLYIPPSNFLIHPFVAFKNVKPKFNPSAAEVKRIVIVSINDLLKENAVSLTEKHHTYMGYVTAPAYVAGGIKIWGATSMILSEFLSLVVD